MTTEVVFESHDFFFRLTRQLICKVRSKWKYNLLLRSTLRHISRGLWSTPLFSQVLMDLVKFNKPLCLADCPVPGIVTVEESAISGEETDVIRDTHYVASSRSWISFKWLSRCLPHLLPANLESHMTVTKITTLSKYCYSNNWNSQAFL